MNRSRLMRAVEKLLGAWPEDGYVVDSTETDDTPDEAFCWAHADMVARGEAILTGCSMFIRNIAWGETDSTEWCAFHGCNQELDTGSLTDYGVDNALALTETKPFQAHVTAYELKRSAWAMREGDKRWPAWERQARRVLKERRRS